jgi:hypothetical protein
VWEVYASGCSLHWANASKWTEWRRDTSLHKRNMSLVLLLSKTAGGMNWCNTILMLILFSAPNSSSLSMTLGFTRPVTELSNGRFLGVNRGRRVSQPNRHLWADFLYNVGSSKSHSPIGLSSLLLGQLYFFCVAFIVFNVSLYCLCMLCFVWAWCFTCLCDMYIFVLCLIVVLLPPVKTICSLIK